MKVRTVTRDGAKEPGRVCHWTDLMPFERGSLDLADQKGQWVVGFLDEEATRMKPSALPEDLNVPGPKVLKDRKRSCTRRTPTLAHQPQP